MTAPDSTTEELRKSLYTYWHDLPYFKTVDTSIQAQVEESEVGSFIIKYIRDGIEDKFGNVNNLLRRHAFTAKELHAAYKKERKGQKYSQSNFHFHIKNLVESGHLKEIAKILEGRHYNTYYGRTAIAFIGQYDSILTDTTVQSFFGPLKQLIKEMNPEIDSNAINQLVNDNILSMQDFYYRLFSWVKDKYPLLYKSKVELKAFIELVGHYAFFHKEFAGVSKKIGSLLDLDKIMSYERYQFENRKSK
ncbi:MAG: hypothetical protein ACXAEF_14810 [Candidatus Thorarchaeota archaeon]|jgi:hypothetical protein